MKGIIALTLFLLSSGSVFAQSTTTNCTKTDPDHVNCKSTADPEPSGGAVTGFTNALNKNRADREAAASARKQAEANAQQAEASCIGNGSTPYRGHCLTTAQYADAKKTEADQAAAVEAEKKEKAAEKQAKKDAKAAKKQSSAVQGPERP